MTHTILVTGGIGTLGRAVVETALLAGHNVRVFSRRQATSPELPLRLADRRPVQRRGRRGRRDRRGRDDPLRND